jgi:RNA polymerase sigma factor (sigma-70 family)
MDEHQLRDELQRHHAESYGWALCCCRHDADAAQEVLQRAYLKMLAGQARYQGAGCFKTWLFAVIRKTAQDEWRRRWLAKLKLLAYAGRLAVRRVPLPEAALQADTVKFAVRAAVNALPSRQREVLYLVFYQTLSLSQAAAVMGISVGAARTHYDRGKKALRGALSGQQEIGDGTGRHRSEDLVLQVRPGRAPSRTVL